MKIILSIDGGGIRGIIPAAILDYLEKKIQEIQNDPRIRIGNLVDFVAGTSTGSILGSLMLLPCSKSVHPTPKYAMQEIIELYVKYGPQIFYRNLWHSIKTLGGIFGSKYPSSNIENPLIQMSNHYKMKDLIKPCLFTGYDINKRQINIYTNQDKNDKYSNYYIKDIIRGSSSIPGYFSPAYFREGLDTHTVIDGGIFANNPSVIAFLEFSKINPDINPNNILMISLGTGKSKNMNFSYETTKKWGITLWIYPIIDIILSGSSEIADYEMKKLFDTNERPDNYKRINPILNYSASTIIDSSRKNMINLLKDAKTYIEENKILLNTLAREICDLNYFIGF